MRRQTSLYTYYRFASFKIGIPWHHCDPLEGSHFHLVFGKLLSSVVWWLVLPQFQLHQPLTSCIGQLVVICGGFFGGTGYPESTLRTSTQLMQGVFGGYVGRLEDWTEPFHVIPLILFQVSDIYQFIQSISVYQSKGVLDWLVPDTKVWAQLPKAFCYLSVTWNHLDRLRSFQSNFCTEVFQKFPRWKFTWLNPSLWLFPTISYTKNANPFNMETLQNKSFFEWKSGTKT